MDGWEKCEYLSNKYLFKYVVKDNLNRLSLVPLKNIVQKLDFEIIRLAQWYLLYSGIKINIIEIFYRRHKMLIQGLGH